MMFEQAFKNIDDDLRKDAGVSTELDYVEQTSWILFLKYLDDLDKDKSTEGALSDTPYNSIFTKEYQWNTWACPKKVDGSIDYNLALTGDDLIDFVNVKLFPYLKKFKTNADHADTLEYKVGEIFSELKNKIQSGYTLRSILDTVDTLSFRSQEEKHELSYLYESKIQSMGNAGRNGGEYYTPRPLIKTIIQVVSPRIGDRIYDGAVGSAGFLVEAFEYLKSSKELTTKDLEILQKKTFYGKEKKPLPYIIGTMNMILHGIEAPHIIHTNTLSENITSYDERDRYDIVIANPPFGGSERKEVQQNFPIKTAETASLFLQHFIRILKANGKAGIVIKNTFLTNTDNATVKLREYLLNTCNLHTILDLPQGAFFGAGVKTVVLFFEKGSPTKSIWYYQLNLERNLGKTSPLNEMDLDEFIVLQKSKIITDNSWVVRVEDLSQETFLLTPLNPNSTKNTLQKSYSELVNDIKLLNSASTALIEELEETHEK